MLSALLGIIILSFFYYWWDLLKMYRRYKKGVDEMSKSKFYTFLVLNYVVTSILALMVLSFVPLHSGEYKFLWPYINLLTALTQVIPLSISYYIYRQYNNIKKGNNDTITKTDEFTLDDNDNK
jgi:hypothetical protein